MGRGLGDLEKMANELPYKIIETDRKLIKVKIFDNLLCQLNTKIL